MALGTPNPFAATPQSHSSIDAVAADLTIRREVEMALGTMTSRRSHCMASAVSATGAITDDYLSKSFKLSRLIDIMLTQLSAGQGQKATRGAAPTRPQSSPRSDV